MANILNLYITSVSIFVIGLVAVDGRTIRNGAQYDLGNGPVFYEAYYPDTDEQETPPKPEKKFFDREPVIEKSYQFLYPGDYRNVESKVSELHEQSYTDTADHSANYISARPVPSFINQQSILNEPIINNDRRTANLENALNILIDAIRERGIEAHPIFHNFKPDRVSNIQTNEPRIEASGKLIFPNENFGYEERSRDDIFKPRPQVINYIFSPTREPRKIESFDYTKTRTQADANDENRINLSEGISTKISEENSNVPQVASIEVNQQPRHKHRHHHGEKTKSNNRKILSSPPTPF